MYVYVDAFGLPVCLSACLPGWLSVWLSVCAVQRASDKYDSISMTCTLLQSEVSTPRTITGQHPMSLAILQKFICLKSQGFPAQGTLLTRMSHLQGLPKAHSPDNKASTWSQLITVDHLIKLVRPPFSASTSPCLPASSPLVRHAQGCCNGWDILSSQLLRLFLKPCHIGILQQLSCLTSRVRSVRCETSAHGSACTRKAVGVM